MVPVAPAGLDQPAPRGDIPHVFANGGTKPAPTKLESAIWPSNLATGNVNLMTPARMPLADLLCQLGETDSDALTVLLAPAVSALSEAEVSAVFCAEHRERVEESWASRNGDRFWCWDTMVGPLGVEIPKPRQCSLVPRSLQPTEPSGLPSRRHRCTWCPTGRWTTWWPQRWLTGVQERRKADLRGTGPGAGPTPGLARGQCHYPCRWFDAAHDTVREGGQVGSGAVSVPVAVGQTGERRILRVAVGTREIEPSTGHSSAAHSGPASAGSARANLNRSPRVDERFGAALIRTYPAGLQRELPHGLGHQAAQARRVGSAGTCADEPCASPSGHRRRRMVAGVRVTTSGMTTPLRDATIASRRRAHLARTGICSCPEQELLVFAIRARHSEVDICDGEDWRVACPCLVPQPHTLQAQAGPLGDGRIGARRSLAASGAALPLPMRPPLLGPRSLSELTKSASPLSQVGRRLAICSSTEALFPPCLTQHSPRAAVQHELRAPLSTPVRCLVDYTVMERRCSRCRLMAPRSAVPEPKPGWTQRRASLTDARAADGSMPPVPEPVRERMLVASSSMAPPTSHPRAGQPSSPSLVADRSP